MRTPNSILILPLMMVLSSACDPNDVEELGRSFDPSIAAIVEGTVQFELDFGSVEVELVSLALNVDVVCYEPSPEGVGLHLRFFASTGQPIHGWVHDVQGDVPLATNFDGTELSYDIEGAALEGIQTLELRFSTSAKSRDDESIQPKLVIKPKKDCPTGIPKTGDISSPPWP